SDPGAIDIVGATGTLPNITAYDARKGGMGLSSAHPVLWRLPTLQDYTGAYQNGMAYVLPRIDTSFWTASAYPGNPDDAMYFYVESSGFVVSHVAFRGGGSDVRCVGR